MNAFTVLTFIVISCVAVTLGEFKFNCDFDVPILADICDGGIVSNSNPSGLFVTQVQNYVVTTDLTVTDYTSITKPTTSNKRCRIPFSFNGADRYFCVSSASKYQCETSNTSSILDECEKGYFARFRATAATGIFTAFINFTKPIDLIQPGKYTLSFHSFIYCPKENCDTEDSIAVKIRDGDVNVYREVFRVGTKDGRVRDFKWNKETIDFDARSTQLLIRFEFERSKAITNVQTVLAIDELEITEFKGTTLIFSPSTTSTTEAQETASEINYYSTTLEAVDLSSLSIETRETSSLILSTSTSEASSQLTLSISSETTTTNIHSTSVVPDTSAPLSIETSTITTDDQTTVSLSTTAVEPSTDFATSTDPTTPTTTISSTTIISNTISSSLSTVTTTSTSITISTSTDTDFTTTSPITTTSIKTTTSSSTTTTTSTSTFITSSASSSISLAEPTSTKQPSQSAAIIGGSIGGVAALILIIAISSFIILKWKKKQQVGTSETSTETTTTSV